MRRGRMHDLVREFTAHINHDPTPNVAASTKRAVGDEIAWPRRAAAQVEQPLSRRLLGAPLSPAIHERVAERGPWKAHRPARKTDGVTLRLMRALRWCSRRWIEAAAPETVFDLHVGAGGGATDCLLARH